MGVDRTIVSKVSIGVQNLSFPPDQRSYMYHFFVRDPQNTKECLWICLEGLTSGWSTRVGVSTDHRD